MQADKNQGGLEKEVEKRKENLSEVTQWVTARRRAGKLVLLNDSPAGYITLSLFPTAVPVSFTSQDSPIKWKSAENVLNIPKFFQKKKGKKHTIPEDPE